MAKATLFISLGSAAFQVGSALSVAMFATVAVSTVSSLRFITASVILLAVFRPHLRGRSRANWLAIAGMGLSMAANGLGLLYAMDRLDLGIVLTLNFLGPCVVALVGSHRPAEVACALVALGGVVLIAGPGGGFDLIGFIFAITAAFSMALYTLMTEKVGKAGGLSDLSLAMAIAAVLLLPFGAPGFGDLTWSSLAAVAGIGIIGTVTPPCFDTLAGRASSARVVGTLFSVDPALAAVAGYFMLGQTITWPIGLGMAVVTAAGALLMWSAPAAKPDGQPAGPVTDQPTGQVGGPSAD
ncbi:MAG: EamA family transporter [Bifidobacteriaceae bacterium]|nr:EamA family transporter [Bifidobacteriaceae bacterium]